VLLLGVRAVIAESFERIHRSNLVGMGVLPLEFVDGQSRDSLGLTGFEEFAVEGVAAAVESSGRSRVRVRADGKNFEARARIDTPAEADYYSSGGILPFVLRQLAAK
jgi:aconitate hydratase